MEIRRWAGLLVLVVTGGFFAREVYRQWQTLQSLPLPRLSVGLFALSYGLFVLGTLAAPVAALYIARAAGSHQVGLTAMITSHYRSIPSKYLPGGIWVLVGKGYNYTAAGLQPRKIPYLLAAETTLTLVAAATYGSAYLLPGPWVGGAVALAIGVAGGTAAGGLLASRRSALASGPGARRGPFPGALGALAIYGLFWLAIGAAFASFVHSIQADTTSTTWLGLGAAFSLAWAAGFVAFVVPSGLGVREGALYVLLKPQLGPDMALLISLGARLWWTSAEVLAVAVVLASIKLIRKQTGPSPG